MTQAVYENRRNYQDRSDGKRGNLSLSLGFEGDRFWVISKFSNSNSSSVDAGATVGTWGFIGSHGATKIDIKSSDVVNVDISGVVSPWSGGRPGAYREIFSSQRQSPTGIKINNISPTDRDFLQGIGDHNPFVIESNFWAEYECVDARNNSTGDADAGSDSCDTTLVETRPSEESAHQDPKSSKDEVGVGAIDISVAHYQILSHHSSKARHSVKAVQ